MHQSLEIVLAGEGFTIGVDEIPVFLGHLNLLQLFPQVVYFRL
jgi:hypothetical protein